MGRLGAFGLELGALSLTQAIRLLVLAGAVSALAVGCGGDTARDEPCRGKRIETCQLAEGCVWLKPNDELRFAPGCFADERPACQDNASCGSGAECTLYYRHVEEGDLAVYDVCAAPMSSGGSK